jgi:hypothetical protein
MTALGASEARTGLTLYLAGAFVLNCHDESDSYKQGRLGLDVLYSICLRQQDCEKNERASTLKPTGRSMRFRIVSRLMYPEELREAK